MKRKDDIEIKDELIVRYLSGEAGPEEAMALHNWLLNPVNKAYFSELQETWEGAYSAKKMNVPTADNAWKNVAASMDTVSKSSFSLFESNRFRIGIAAALTIAIVSGILLYVKLRENNANEIIASVNEVSISTKDSLRDVIFSDHSKVVLYHNTTLRYPETFGKQQREISLSSGEAFFTIERNATKPFIIHTGLANIKVIGTAFNVTLTKDNLEVGVKEGKVMIYTSDDSIYVESGSTAIVRSRTPMQIMDSVNANAWGYATHNLVYKNTSVRRVIEDLAKIYPYSITVSNKNIYDCRLTATFDTDSVENLLALIAESLNLSVTRNDSVFILEGEGCP